MNYKTINTVGTGYSGASAIYEFLQKTDIFYDPFPNNQFSISYDPGGLLDLENIVKNQFTINKSKQAYNDFIELIDYYCKDKKGIKVGKNFTKFNKNLNYILSNFLNNIIIFNYHGETAFSNYKRGLLKKLKFKIIDYFYKIAKKKRSNRELLFIFCDYENFKKEVNKLIFELFQKNNIENKDVILEHAGTIFNPFSSMKYFPNPYCICVIRDPRDIFTELKRKANKFPGYDVEVFCKWYQHIFNKIDSNEKLNKKVLFINFEDFVINRQATINKIFEHIEYEKIDYKKVNYNFIRCENNINLYKKELNKKEIFKIEDKLKSFLYNF